MSYLQFPNPLPPPYALMLHIFAMEQEPWQWASPFGSSFNQRQVFKFQGQKMGVSIGGMMDVLFLHVHLKGVKNHSSLYDIALLFL